MIPPSNSNYIWVISPRCTLRHSGNIYKSVKSLGRLEIDLQFSKDADALKNVLATKLYNVIGGKASKGVKNILGEEMTPNVVFSCGSGVTASVLALAYSLINNKYMPTIYDGSWAEYGKIKI